MSEWNDINEIKPEHDQLCYVYNNKWGPAFQAIYYKNYDVFVQYAPHLSDHPVLSVTHWVALPHPRLKY